MKKIFILILFPLFLACASKEVNGVWISYKDKVIDPKYGYRGNSVGLIIDFDQSEITSKTSDTILKININFETKEITFLNEKEKLHFKVYNKDSLEISIAENSMAVFKPLILNNKLISNKAEIENFLINQDFDHIRDSLKLNFTEKIDLNTDFNKNRELKSKFLNYEETVGYWYITEKQENFFLSLSIAPMTGKFNVYQIISINEIGIKLKGVIEYDFLPSLTELKTSL